jgi:PAS domain S-box-containing protein
MTYYDNDIPLRSIGTTMDITERKQTQHALDRYNQFTNSILDTINSLVFVVDIEGRIVRFNRACEKLTGYSFENINGKIIWSILPRSYDQECLRKCYQTPHLDNFPNKIRMDWPTAKGIIRTIDWENSAVVGEDGNIDYIIAAGIDITDRLLVEKMLEDQLRNLEQKVNERTRELDTMFALSPDGFVMINNQHNVIFTNPAFLEMTGLHFKDVIDISIDVFIKRMLALCDVSADSQSVDLVYFSDNPILYLQRPIQRVMSCIQRDIQDPGGRCIGKVLYFRDITHESEVDRIKSEFLSTAAHEFRTPLSSILGFSELLLSREFDKESSKKYIEIINRQSNHLKHLLDELLDLARIDARADRDFIMSDNTLEEVIQLVIEDSQAFATEKHELKTDFVDAWPLVSFDSDKIQQALFNILSNAYKYSPQGGTITCSTLLKHVGKKQMFGIRIEDQGIGMTPDELNHIGERFYRADTTGTIPGTGLGVSLVKEIIELHKGELEITSTLGQGAQFTVWLPVDPKNIQSVKRSV